MLHARSTLPIPHLKRGMSKVRIESSVSDPIQLNKVAKQ